MIKKLIILFFVLVFTSTAYADTIVNYGKCTMGSDPLLTADGDGAQFTCERITNSGLIAGFADTTTGLGRLSIRTSTCTNFTLCANREIITVKAVSGTSTYTFTVKARAQEGTSTGNWAQNDVVEMVGKIGRAHV